MEGKSMAEKLINHPAAPTLPMPVEKQPPAAAPFLHIDDVDVQFVNRWTFFNALGVNISFAVGVAYCYIATLIICRFPSLASWLLPRVPKLTDAESTLAAALLVGMLWCSTPQAAAGALALLLPCHRWRLRRAAAYAALALTVASHCMYAGAVLVYVHADPEGLFLKIGGSTAIFLSAVVDLIGFLVLLPSRLGKLISCVVDVDQLGDYWDVLQLGAPLHSTVPLPRTGPV